MDDHLDSLLKTIIDLEQKEGKKIEANFITWRGMMTKVSNVLMKEGPILTFSQFMAAIFSDRDG